MARVVLAGFALAALQSGADTLSPRTLADYAAANAGNALFVSLTAGLICGALLPWPRPESRYGWLATLPLLAVMIAALFATLRWGGFGLGIVLGGLPLFVGSILPSPRQNRDPNLRDAAPAWWLLVTLAISLAEPLLVVAMLPLPWMMRWRRSWPGLTLARRLLPTLSFLFFLSVIWLATTVAGSPWVRWAGYAALQPLSISAERLLGLMGIAALTALLAPWPLSRFGPLLTPLPAIAVAGYRIATALAPTGVATWLPAAALLLVPAALFAALLREWRTALGTIALLAALTGTVLGGLGAALITVMAIWPSLIPGSPPTQSTIHTAPWRDTLTSLGLALSVGALLSTEVVMATTLAAGTAILLARRSATTTEENPHAA